MKKEIRKNLFFVLMSGAFLLSFCFLALIALTVPSFVEASENEDITVSAYVESWLTFSISTSTVNLAPYLVTAAGELNIASSSDVNLNIGTNDSAGWSVTIGGLNGGLIHTDGDLIQSIALFTTSTLKVNEETRVYGYGAQADDIMGGVTIHQYYDFWGSETVASIASTSAQTLATYASANSAQNVVKLKIKAAAPFTQKTGFYNDTITLTAIPAT